MLRGQPLSASALSLPCRKVKNPGHYHEAEDLRVDTHGASVIDPVWDLLDKAYARFGAIPTLLERDFNIPPLPELMREIRTINSLQEFHRRQLKRQEIRAS